MSQEQRFVPVYSTLVVVTLVVVIMVEVGRQLDLAGGPHTIRERGFPSKVPEKSMMGSRHMLGALLQEIIK